MYKAQGAGAADGDGAGAGDEKVVDADFEEVDGDKKD
jgi:molecular chaperone DnaK